MHCIGLLHVPYNPSMNAECQAHTSRAWVYVTPITILGVDYQGYLFELLKPHLYSVDKLTHASLYSSQNVLLT